MLISFVVFTTESLAKCVNDEIHFLPGVCLCVVVVGVVVLLVVLWMVVSVEKSKQITKSAVDLDYAGGSWMGMGMGKGFIIYFQYVVYIS